MSRRSFGYPDLYSDWEPEDWDWYLLGESGDLAEERLEGLEDEYFYADAELPDPDGVLDQTIPTQPEDDDDFDDEGSQR